MHICHIRANMRPNQIRRLNLVTMSLVDDSRHLPVTAKFLCSSRPSQYLMSQDLSQAPPLAKHSHRLTICHPGISHKTDLYAFPTWGLRGGLRRKWMNAFAAKCWSWAQVTKYQHQASIPARKVMALAQRQSKCLGEKSARKQPAP